MKVWITRARPGADQTAARLTALGFTPLVIPLLVIRPLAVTLDLEGVEALAFTSANGVAAFAALSVVRSLPVLTVGEATARAARDAGFAQVRSADGDLTALAALIRAQASGLQVLHPGAAEPAGDLAAAVGDTAVVRSVPVYATVETGVAAPRSWDAVLIHSPRAARALATTLTPGGASGRLAVAISAAAAPLDSAGFAAVQLATTPTEAALLEALVGGPAPALGKRGPDV